MFQKLKLQMYFKIDLLEINVLLAFFKDLKSGLCLSFCNNRFTKDHK